MCKQFSSTYMIIRIAYSRRAARQASDARCQGPSEVRARVCVYVWGAMTFVFATARTRSSQVAFTVIHRSSRRGRWRLNTACGGASTMCMRIRIRIMVMALHQTMCDFNWAERSSRDPRHPTTHQPRTKLQIPSSSLSLQTCALPSVTPILCCARSNSSTDR